ncbi:phytosulfokine receptor 1-like isoform X2 [Tasmannia lanceolata]|uniref:phytosulfokine receptor 1-like isoform X2 n=1 Tax=Tasmannia lanceolata TaxID=3420 RepID=UPI004064C149
MGLGYFWVFFTFLGYCFQAQVSNSLTQSCNTKDLSALEGFLSHLDTGIYGWSNASDCCTWVGVDCEFSSVLGNRVVGLALGNKGLKGIVSESLPGLHQLKVLNLSYNSFQDQVPSELFHLKRLKVLDLSSNRFSGLIPPDTDLPSLRIFNISGNSFNGSQPLLARSVNLESFIISSNQFSGSVNTGICNTSSRISVLQLSWNKFSGNFPIGFGNCRYINELFLNSNDLMGNLADDLFGLPSLERLYIQNNRLSGPLSDRIGQLPPSLLNLSTLRGLHLTNNFMDGEINLNCTTMVNLDSLNLGSNRFHGRILDNLSSCSKLKTINLSNNSLGGQIPENFKNLQALSYLALSNNTLCNISGALSILRQCNNLTTLVLTKNFKDEEMPVNGITGFESIMVLAIAKSGLSGSIPVWLRRSSKLQVLDLSLNQFEGSIPLWFGNLDHLFYLDLSNNSLTGEIPRSLTQLESLISSPNTSLEEPSPDFPIFWRRNQSSNILQYNQVRSLPPSLDLSCNKLTGPIWKEFGRLKKVHVLDLNGNNLSGSIPDELSGMGSLEILDLSSNNLSGSIPASLTKLNFLSSFSIADNHLSGLIPSEGQFSTFPNSSFEGNKGLCGNPLPSCEELQIPSQQSKEPQRNKSTIKRIANGIRAIIGWPFAIGAVAGFLLSVILCTMTGILF